MADEEDGTALFRKVVGKVRRIEHDGVEPGRKRPPAKPRPRPDPEPPVMPGGTFRESDGHEAAGTLAADAYFRPGLQRGVLRKLRRGQYAVDSDLDLHGTTAREAYRRLAGFLAHACGDRVRCVRIVTGKGLSSPGMRPVLKPKVAAWLRDDERVLAFTGAPRNDGGSGAFYVLLRSRRE